MRLIGDIQLVESLSRNQTQRMYELLKSYFEGADEDIFYRDLSEKKWVILLLDRLHKSIEGFSTQMLIDHTIDNVPIKVLFSGDTIINRSYWGSNELAKQWLKLAEHLISEYSGSRLYWFLISKGYKTYRFLPTYFKRFYPCCYEETPYFEKQIMDELSRLKYLDQYNSQDGVIRFAKNAMSLKQGVADIDEKRIKDPHIQFFIKRNPGYWKGDELVCLAEFSNENLTKPVFKMKTAIEIKRYAPCPIKQKLK